MNAWQFVANQNWLMTETALVAVLAFVERVPLTVEMVTALHAGEAEAVAATKGRPMDGTHSVSVRDGVATIPVHGPISRYADFFSDFSGGTTVETLARDFRQAMDNPAIRAIVLDVNSPGGSADGVGELAGMIYAARGTKPVSAYVGNLGASAAYYLASACDEIVVASAASVGSIGVVCCVNPKRSGPNAPVEIVSTQSPKKRLDVANPDGRAELQSQVDAIAQVFIDDVARFRGVKSDAVTTKFGQGGIRIGKAAVDAGMADRLGTYESLHRELSTGQRPVPKPPTGIKAASATPLKDSRMPSTWKRLSMFLLGSLPDEPAAEADDVDVDVDTLLASLSSAKPVQPRLAASTVDAKFVEERVAEAIAKTRAEEQAKAQTAFLADVKVKAESFLLGEVKAGRVKPAEVNRLIGLYTDYALADQERPIKASVGGTEETYSRLGHFTAEIGARGKHTLTTEAIPADASSLPAAFRDCKILPQATTDPDPSKPRASIVEQLLKATDEGKAILAASTK